ncbi:MULTISPECIES: hypothetical protein [Bacillus]|nr:MULTISPECIES: hypothetical protein [Bacillus]WFA03972.1 hypothetical protein P3X63_15180 [Bacillus sp. HSf4]
MRLKKKKRREHAESDYWFLLDLIEPLYYVLRFAFRGIVKFIN